MKKIFFLFITLLTANVTLNAAQAAQVATPDFAYPLTVIENADTSLDQAIKHHDNDMIVRSVMDYTLAKTTIDADSISAAICRIDSVLALKVAPSAASLLHLFKATLLSNYYADNQFRIISRTNTNEDTSDLTLWGSNRFTEIILAEINVALANTADLKSTPITAFASSISCQKEAQPLYPTLFDFVAVRSVNLLQNITGYCNVFSLNYLEHPGSTLPKRCPATIASAYRICVDRINIHRKGSPAHISAVSEYIDFITDNLLNSASTQDSLTKRFDIIKSLYSEYQTSPYSALILAKSDNIASSDDRLKPQLYALTQEYITRFPNDNLTELIQRIASELTLKTIHINGPAIISPDTPTEFTLSIANTNSVTLLLKKIPEEVNDRFISRKKIEEYPTIDTFHITCDDRLPFNATRTFAVKVTEFGRYLFIPAEDIFGQSGAVEGFYCSNLSGFTTGFNDINFYAVNPYTGIPQSGVTVSLNNGNTRQGKKSIDIVTDANGRAIFRANSLDSGYGQFSLSKGNDYLPTNIYFSGRAEQESDPSTIIEGRTYFSLPVYHPGDTLDFVSIIYTCTPTGTIDKRAPLDNSKIKAVLFDCNRNRVDSLTINTDNFGRISGRLQIPQTGITGQYLVDIYCNDRIINRTSVMVSDYKLPDFTVDIETALTDNLLSGITGTATTYSGMPVAGATVKVELMARQSMFYRVSDDPSTNITKETVTGSDGTFKIEISPDERDIFASGNYLITATATVTSTSGETVSASTSFANSDRLDISANLSERVFDISNQIDFSFLYVKNLKNESLSVPLTIKVSNATDSLKINTVSSHSGILSLPLDKLPSGSYTFTFSCPDNDANTYVINNIVLYRPDDVKSPVDQPVWTPCDNVNTASGSVVVPFWTLKPDTYVLISTCTNNKILSEKWHILTEGRNELTFDIPDGEDQMQIAIFNGANGQISCRTLIIKRIRLSDKLDITIENFRDRLVSGATENMTIKIKSKSGDTETYPVILDIYNKALDAIYSQQWNFFNASAHYNFASCEISRLYYAQYFHQSDIRSRYQTILQPSFNLYGMSLTGGIRAFPAVRMMSSARGSFTGNDMGVEVAEDEISYDSEVTMNASFSSNKTAVTVEQADGSVAAPTVSLDYRPAEVPLMLFAPRLTTNADGSLEVAINLTEANSTWVMQILSYDSAMHGSVLSRDFVTSKPVMVNPNRPRFLREGDSMNLLTSVYNNTDKEATVSTLIELINPSDYNIIRYMTKTQTLGPAAEGIISIPVYASSSDGAIMVRVTSTSGNYSDGEQFLIPILASEQRTTESEVFYLAPGQTEYTTHIEATEDDEITLSFCENPLWEVATALPGLQSGSRQDAVSVAYSLFASAVSAGLLRDNPDLAKALGERLDAPQPMTSLLAENEQLKQLILSSTPWVGNALSDTERLERLALLFDKKNVSETINSAINQLSALRTPEGGWCWNTYFRSPSAWTTTTILVLLGDLNRQGYLPESTSLADMITAAVHYLDRQAALQYQQHHIAAPSLLAYIHTCFPDIQPASTDASLAISQCVNGLASDWKALSTTLKADASIILDKSGYPSVARQILTSLDQYAVSSPEGGIWWPSVGNYPQATTIATASILNAYAIVNPEAPQIDRIRQYLIMSKQLQDWGDGCAAAHCVNSILSTGTNWLTLPQSTSVTLGDTLLTVNPSDRLSGTFLADIPSGSDNQLRITRDGNCPAWGALMRTSTRQMSEIQPASLPQISITKQMLVERDGVWQPTVAPRLGEIVKVRLIVKTTVEMDYLTITDSRAACLEPVIQTPRPIYCDGAVFYLENRDATTNLFIDTLSRGTYILEYEMKVNNAGTFSSGIATIQSQYAPEYTAHSGGTLYTVEK